MLFLPLHHIGIAAAAPPPLAADEYDDGVSNFQPSLAVVLGILTVMFSLTFALLLYARCSQRHNASSAAAAGLHQNRQRSSLFGRGAPADSRFGLSKKNVESLPFFRFGALRGSKNGLECAVCLSKYEEFEILRLLPKCRHAFHIDCVDRWLAGNPTCPLCRSTVTAEDASLLNCSSFSSRFIASNSIHEEEANLDLNRSKTSCDFNLNIASNSSANEDVELFVEREEEAGSLDRTVRRSSSIFGTGSSFRRFFVREVAMPVSGSGSGWTKALHKHNHKIVFSDVVFKNRWSNVTSSELMFLQSEMMLSVSAISNRGQIAAAGGFTGDSEIVQSKSTEETEKKRWMEQFAERDLNLNLSSPTRSLLNSAASSGGDVDSPAMKMRVMSEITLLSRFRELGWRNYRERENPATDAGEEAAGEDKRRTWFPIARKTVERFASRAETESRKKPPGISVV